jgi:hypothetical protein
MTSRLALLSLLLAGCAGSDPSLQKEVASLRAEMRTLEKETAELARQVDALASRIDVLAARRGMDGKEAASPTSARAPAVPPPAPSPAAAPAPLVPAGLKVVKLKPDPAPVAPEIPATARTRAPAAQGAAP